MNRYDNALDAIAVFEAIRDDNPTNLHALFAGLTDGALLEGFYVLTESLIAALAANTGSDPAGAVELHRAMFLNAAAGAA